MMEFHQEKIRELNHTVMMKMNMKVWSMSHVLVVKLGTTELEIHKGYKLPQNIRN